MYLPILPLALIQVTLRPRWPGVQNLYDDWANFAYYSTYLLAGFLLACQPALERAVERERKRAAAVALGAMGVLLGSVLGVVSSPSVILTATAVAGWSSVLALLGFARARAPRTSPALDYLTESAFPVYLLHQSAIVLLGYLVVQLPWGIAPKFTVLLLAAVAATLAVYHFAVHRLRVLRFLFGMKVGPAATPLGRWWAEGGAAQVEIRRCGDGLCGDVVWLRSPFDEDGCALLDRHNGNPALRQQPVLGLRVLRGLETVPGRDTEWSGGTIYDPSTGNTYRSTLTLEGENRLRLRGYVGIPLLGRTTTWVRVGTENTRCHR